MVADELALLDLDGYLARIGFSAAPDANLKAFSALHLAHATHIPFENLDILLGRPIRIDLPSIQEKIVQRGRGGYCYEQNRLFAAVLSKLGFRVTFLAGRARYRVNRLLPRTHVCLLVEVNGSPSPWLADVGYGTIGLLQPIPLVVNQSVEQFGWNYRLIEEAGLFVLQTQQAGEWQSLYAFSLEPQCIPDLEMANYYISTHPESRFVQTLVVQRSNTRERFLLRDLDLIVDRGGDATTRTLRDQDELIEVLAEQFDLHFPKGTRFRI